MPDTTYADQSTNGGPGRVRALAALGQSVWLDCIDRDFLTDGGLQHLIDRDGVAGVTSNPAIFEKAIGHSSAYDAELEIEFTKRDATALEAYEAVVITDIIAAADILRPVHRRLGGRDGYVSIEVSPDLARDTDATVAEATRLWLRIDRPNVMIKIPGTDEAIPAIRRLIANGVNVNVTLLFSVDRYKEVLNAYLDGLEERVGRGLGIDTVAGVASFFVSRIDTVADGMLDARIKGGDSDAQSLEALKGKLAIASAKMAYQHFLTVQRGSRWRTLADKGALPQRLLWASTGTKNPAYSDVLYVNSLIGSDTINTMPPGTMDAFRDHGTIDETLVADTSAASASLLEAKRLDVDLEAIAAELVDAGVKQFAAAAMASIEAVARKGGAVDHRG